VNLAEAGAVTETLLGLREIRGTVFEVAAQAKPGTAIPINKRKTVFFNKEGLEFLIVSLRIVNFPKLAG
jgi:hypothetical protein